MAEIDERPDGFRPRRIRPAGWREQALAEGWIRDDAAPDPDEGKDYSGATVIRPPLGRLGADDGTE